MTDTDTLGPALARTVQLARTEQNVSPAALAERSGVSRAMIARIEKGEVQPTAALLARLAVGLDLTLTELIARAENDCSRLRRAGDQEAWVDPDTGYSRRSVSPAASRGMELIDVRLPVGAEVSYPTDSYRFVDQQIWVLAGRLRFVEGHEAHLLDAGDCLQLGPPAVCTFANDGPGECRYLVALGKRGRPGR